MSVSITEFWNLAVQSRLFTPQQCQQFAGSFAQATEADPAGSADALAQWLVAQNVLSRYQAKVLMDRQPGPFIYGDYLVYDRVEQGRLAGLFRAVHATTKHPVCLQFLTGSAVADPQQFAQLAEFCAFTMQQPSPQLTQSYHIEDLGTYKFIVLQDLQGETLEPKLSGEPLPPPTACGLALHLAMGLVQLHRAGRVHGEIRPSNVWLDATGHTRLIYFPLWRDPLSGPTTPASGGDLLAAAADTMAPEIISGQNPDARSEIYSLGCLLYQMLTGRTPFQGDVNQKLAGHRSELFRPADHVNPSVPKPIGDVVGYMTEKDPARRYQQAEDVVQALKPYAGPEFATTPQAVKSMSDQAYENWLQQSHSPARPLQMPGNGFPQGQQPPSQPVSQAAAVASQPAATATAAFPAISTQAAATAPIASATANAATPGTVSSRRTQHRGDRKNRQMMIVCGSILAAAAVVVIIIVSLSGDPVDDSQIAVKTGDSSIKTSVLKKTGGNGKVGNPSAKAEAPIRPLRGGEVWLSPTSGPPLDLTYMPRGVQAFIVLRPAEIMAHEEGRYLLVPRSLEEDAGTTAATGSFGPFVTAEVSRLCGGLPWEEIDQVVIGLLPNPNPPFTPLTALVMRTREAVTLNGLTKARGMEYRMAGSSGRIVVAAPAKLGGGGRDDLFENDVAPIDDAMAHAAEAELPRREMEALLRASDNRRHFSMLFAPSFFYSEGKVIWSGLAEGLKKPVFNFLRDPNQIKAGLISVHLTKHAVFLEMRFYGDADKPHPVLASELDQQLEALPKLVEQEYLSINPSMFSKPILLKLLQMVEILHKQTIVGTSQSHAVVRCYLPRRGLSNLAFATYLMLAEKSGGGIGSAKPPKVGPMPKNVAELLVMKKLTLVSSQGDEFQRHLAAISAEIGVEIIIMGRDLQSKGITRNKNTTVNQIDKPVGEIIRSMFKTVDPSGNLVYVIKKDADGKEKIYITILEKALERGDPIPTVFKQQKKE